MSTRAVWTVTRCNTTRQPHMSPRHRRVSATKTSHLAAHMPPPLNARKTTQPDSACSPFIRASSITCSPMTGSVRSDSRVAPPTLRPIPGLISPSARQTTRRVFGVRYSSVAPTRPLIRTAWIQWRPLALVPNTSRPLVCTTAMQMWCVWVRRTTRRHWVMQCRSVASNRVVYRWALVVAPITTTRSTRSTCTTSVRWAIVPSWRGKSCGLWSRSLLFSL